MARSAGVGVSVMALMSLVAGAAVAGFPVRSSAATVIIVHPGQSIQAAVDRARPGDRPGTNSRPRLKSKHDRKTSAKRPRT